MRVLQYTNGFGITTNTFIYHEVSGLKSKGIDIEVLTHTRENKEIFPFEPVTTIPEISRPWLEAKWKGLLRRTNTSYNQYESNFSQRLGQVLDRFKPDVVHCHFGPDGLLLFDNLPERWKNIPLIIHFHGYDASKFLEMSTIYVDRLREVLNLKNVTPIYVSKDMKSRLSIKGLNLESGKLLYYGIDPNQFKRKSNNSQGTRFLQVSSFVEKKGHTFSLEAIKLFLDSVNNPEQYTFTFAGGGLELETIKSKAKHLGILNRIVFPGWVTQKEAVELMEKADYFIHHSVTADNGDKEGLPNAILEAMAMKLPIISTLHSGIPEAVEDGVNGILVEEKDVQGYAKAMLDILEWKYLDINRQKVKQIFSIKHHVEALEKRYKSIVNSNSVGLK